MRSLKDIATVKTVIKICNDPDLKKEILCAPGSDYDRNKGNSKDANHLRWNEVVEQKAKVIVEKLGIEKQLREKVTSIVFLVGMRMLIWAEYHEGTIGLSREYSVNFLNNSFFTPQGLIDSRKAAEELIKDQSLNIKQQYKLACLYCFTDHIRVLFKQMTIEIKKDFYDDESPHRIKQPKFVKFWSYYLMNTDKLKEGKNLDQHGLIEEAVGCGNKIAVEYCLEKTNLNWNMSSLMDAAIEAVGCRIRADPDKKWVFQNQKYRDNEKPWVPSDYYVDILCFLLSRMGEDQQIEFFKKDIKSIECEPQIEWDVKLEFLKGICIRIRHSENRKCFTVLEYFLNWPYQDYFMKKAKLMWEFLSERYYTALLLMICDKIESKYLFSKYGEGNSFDYRELFKEFWCQSPDRYKRQVFYNQEVTFRANKEVKTGVGLLIKLLTLKNFSYEDGETVKLILDSATPEEKENIFSTEEWTSICVKLMNEEKWETLNRYTLFCFLSEEEESKFKRELSFNEKAQSLCIDFAKNDNWNAAEKFIKWSSLPDEEIKKLKEEMIYSEYGLKTCVRQILSDKVSAGKFIRWYLPSEEDVKAFKKGLIFSGFVTDVCTCLTANKQNTQELLTEFINFCLSSEGDDKLKKEAAYRYGGLICKDLISNNEVVDIFQNYDTAINNRIIFKGGKWEEVEKFLTSYFSSEEEIRDFKRNELLKEYGAIIHFQLIESNQWQEAETFFAWLELSVEEIKKLKKSTLLDYGEAWDMFTELVYSEDDDDERFRDFGTKQEAIELLLRWYLTDKEMVLECKDKFKHYEIEDELLKILDLLIEQRLRDLADENSGVERTTSISPNKRFKRDTKEEECGK